MYLGLIKRVLFGNCAPRDATCADQRNRLIKEGRRNPDIAVAAHVSRLPPRPSGQEHPAERPTLLVLQLAHIGDFILSLRAFKKLAEGFPGSEITLVSAPWNVEWAKKTGFFVRVIPFDFFPRLNGHWVGVKPELFNSFEALRLGHFDIAVDLRHDEDTRPCLFRADAKICAGFQSRVEAGRPYLDLILPNMERLQLSDGKEYSLHAELRLELLADAIVNAYGNRSEPHPAHVLAPADPVQPSARPFVILALSAGDSIRRWAPARFVEIARCIIRNGDFSITLVGGEPERSIADEILAELSPDRATAAVDMSLLELTALITRASLVIGLGTGVTHLSATLGVPTIALLSGVSPLSVWRPVGPRLVSLTGEVPCSPCGFKEESQCPFGVTCLTSITSGHVVLAMRQLLTLEPATDRAETTYAHRM